MILNRFQNELLNCQRLVFFGFVNIILGVPLLLQTDDHIQSFWGFIFRSHLEQVEQNWLRYDSILEPISTKLSEAEFIISVHQTVSGTLQSYQQQLQNFRNFDRTLSALQNNLAQISNLTDEMCQLCGAPICEELRDNQKLLFDRSVSIHMSLLVIIFL